MRWKKLTSNSRVAALALAGLALSASLGCSHAINPFADEAVPPEQMTTASERAVREVNATPVVRQREWEPTTTTMPSGGVVHWPLWWEDPFEDKGSEDGKFAWTAEDYVAIPYSFARLLMNTMGWPVSAVVTPPGTPMVSDGRLSSQILGRDHDATPLSRAHREMQSAETTPPDDDEPAQLAQDSDEGDQDDLTVGPPYYDQLLSRK